MARDRNSSVRSDATTERTEGHVEQVQEEQAKAEETIDLKEVYGVVAGLSRSLKCSAAYLDNWLDAHGLDPDTVGTDQDCA